MDQGQFLLAVMFMLLGYMVYKFPNLIAGYNTMSDEDKSKVDIKGLKKWTRNVLVIIGVLLLLSNYLCHYFDSPNYMDYLFYVIIIVGILTLIVGGQKYQNRN
jgi:uncharacterized membrane protein